MTGSATKQSGLCAFSIGLLRLARNDGAHQCRLQWRWKLLSVQQWPLPIEGPQNGLPQTAPTTPPTTAPGGPATTRPTPAPAAAPTISARALSDPAAVTETSAAAKRILRMTSLLMSPCGDIRLFGRNE